MTTVEPTTRRPATLRAATTATYAAFAGPSPLGLFGDHVTIPRARLAVAALQVVALCLAQATRPLAPVAPDRHRALDNQ